MYKCCIKFVLINSFIYSLYLYALFNLTKERIFLLSIQYIYITVKYRAFDHKSC